MEGPISDITRNRFKILSSPEQTPSKALTVPFPEKKTIYDYQFITEVRVLNQDLQVPTWPSRRDTARSGLVTTLSPPFTVRGSVE